MRERVIDGGEGALLPLLGVAAQGKTGDNVGRGT